jgi:hypothetical protein
MKLQNAPALVLALGLQVAPVSRILAIAPTTNPAGFAVVFRWLACAAALLGTYHTVSGASAAIAGVADTSPAGPVSTNAAGTVSQSFSYRIIVTNPGQSPADNFWNAAPLPPGLTINTNVGGNGYITGKPTVAGVYPVQLTAGNTLSPIIVHKDITITIVGGLAPPGITNQPASQIVQAGTDVTFAVGATGDSLTYYWRSNTTLLAAPNRATLTLTNVPTAASALYSVMVSNAVQSVVSSNAQLLVVAPPDASVAPVLSATTNGTQFLLSFNALAGYGYQVQFNDTLAPNHWTLWTNLLPSFTGGSSVLAQNLTNAPQRMFRVVIPAN